MNGRLRKQMEFILEVDKLKKIGRQTYLSDATRKENDAEHSWHLALMAVLLSEHSNQNIDVLKVITMVLIHDVVEIDAGDTVSYGRTFKADKKIRIATVTAGYADGFPRLLSGKGEVLIHGKRAPIVGRICMDQFMVDVSDIPNVTEGDEVTLLGKDGDLCITMEELGDLSGRFNYELACDIGKRVPRIYKMDGTLISE